MNIEICKRCMGNISTVWVGFDDKLQQLTISVEDKESNNICFRHLLPRTNINMFNEETILKMGKFLSVAEHVEFLLPSIKSFEFEFKDCPFYTEQLVDSYQQ